MASRTDTSNRFAPFGISPKRPGSTPRAAEISMSLLSHLNGWEIVAISAMILVLIGARYLPALARGFGDDIKEFKKSSREIQDEISATIHDDDDSGGPLAA